MAIASIPVDVVGNTAQLRRQIEQISRTPVVLDIKTTGGAAPLGKISGDISQIDKSLAAANARVIAFGASASAIYALQGAIRSLFDSFVNTEKKLADINVILNLTQGGIADFGDSLFDIAANTAQSFDTVAEAATELARQGLGVEETLKRTNDALILTRLSGLSAADSVSALTAAINSFSQETLNSTEIVNKLANVDAAFAVSSADLAQAISRVGSSASDAGVSFDELIALVTTAQQITARGGAVIGNSLKTIFTRLGRQDTLDLLGGLGIQTTDAEGKIKNQVQLLQELATAYDQLGQTQQNEVAEKVGGVFQINVLKAALSDLGREFSIYDRALQTSVASTDQAIQRNAQLNQTLSALGSQTLANVQKAASKIGEGLFGPAAENVLNIVNTIAKAADSADTGSIGSKIGKGIIDGIGKFIGGPGLAVITAVIVKLGVQFTKYLGEATKSILGTNQGAKQQAALQQQVGTFLAKNGTLYQSIVRGQTSATQAAQVFLRQIQAQTNELQKQIAVANAVAAAVSRAASASRGVGAARPSSKPTAYAGFIPNFANTAQMAEVIGAANHKGGYKPGKVVKERIYDGNGKSFTGYRNLAEKRTDFVNAAGNKATLIEPPNGFSKNTMTASSGYIPNFAGASPGSSAGSSLFKTKASLAADRIAAQTKARNAAAQERKKKESAKPISIGGASYGYLYASGGASKGESGIAYDRTTGQKINYKFRSAGLKQPFDFKQEVNSLFTPAFNKLAQKIYPKALGGSGQMLKYVDKSATNQLLGRVFESAVRRAIRPRQSVSGEAGGGSFDLPSINLDDRAAFAEIFSGSPVYTAADFKFSKPGPIADKNTRSYVSKLARNAGKNINAKNLVSSPPPTTSTATTKKVFSGFIPNFAASAISEAVSREKSAGAKSSQIKLDKSSKLKSSSNPEGFGVWSTKFESSLGEGISIAEKAGINPKTKGMASGFIPNFENSGGIGSDIAATSLMIGSIASMAYFSDQIGGSGKELSKLKSELKVAGKTLDDAFISNQKRINNQNRVLQSINDEEAAARRNSSLFNPKTETWTEAGKSGAAAREAKLQRLQPAMERSLARERTINRAREIAATPKLEKFGQFASGKGLGLALAAPIVSSMVANAIPQDTKEGRTTAAIVDGVGNAVSLALTGAALGSMAGPWGTAIGGVAGLGVGIYQAFSNSVKEASTNLPELSASAERSAQRFTEFQETANVAAGALQKYSDIMSGGGSQKEANEALDQYQKALENFRPEDLFRIQELQASGKSFVEAISQVTAEIAPEVIKQQALAAAESISKSLQDNAASADIKGLAEQLLRSAFGDLSGGALEEAIKKLIPSGNLEKELGSKGGFDRVMERMSELIPEDQREAFKEIVDALKSGDAKNLAELKKQLQILAEQKALQGKMAESMRAQVSGIKDLQKSLGGVSGFGAVEPTEPIEPAKMGWRAMLDYIPTEMGFDPSDRSFKPMSAQSGGYKFDKQLMANAQKAVEVFEMAKRMYGGRTDSSGKPINWADMVDSNLKDTFTKALMSQYRDFARFSGGLDLPGQMISEKEGLREANRVLGRDENFGLDQLYVDQISRIEGAEEAYRNYMAQKAEIIRSGKNIPSNTADYDEALKEARAQADKIDRDLANGNLGGLSNLTPEEFGQMEKSGAFSKLQDEDLRALRQIVNDRSERASALRELGRREIAAFEASQPRSFGQETADAIARSQREYEAQRRKMLSDELAKEKQTSPDIQAAEREIAILEDRRAGLERIPYRKKELATVESELADARERLVQATQAEIDRIVNERLPFSEAAQPVEPTTVPAQPPTQSSGQQPVTEPAPTPAPAVPPTTPPVTTPAPAPAPAPQPVSPYNVPGAVIPGGGQQMSIGSASITVGNGQVSISSLAGGNMPPNAGAQSGTQQGLPQPGGAVPGGNIQSQALTITASNATISIANAQQSQDAGAAPNLDIINQFTSALNGSISALNGLSSLGDQLKTLPESLKSSLNFQGLNEQVTSQLTSTIQGFGENVNTAGQQLSSSLTTFAGDVRNLNLSDLASSISQVSEKAREFASLNFNEPIQVDISGQIETPQIRIDANINVAALQASINSMANSIKQIVTSFKNDLERRLERVENDIRSLRQSSRK